MRRRSAQQLQLLGVGPYGTATVRQRTRDAAHDIHLVLQCADTFKPRVQVAKRLVRGAPHLLSYIPHPQLERAVLGP